MMLCCRRCGVQFRRRHKTGQIPKYCSRRCALKNWAEKNPKRRAELNRKHNTSKYGLTVDELDCLIDEQGGKCAICRQPPPGVSGTAATLHVDHCHATGRVRALLCSKCNTAIGLMSDSPSLLRSAAQYLEDHL
jgi:hypothetical protein